MHPVQEIRAAELPYRPWPVKVINGLGRALGAVGIQPVRLDRDRLMAEAARQAGSDDFGDDGFIEGLERLIDSLQREADLNLLGTRLARGNLLSALVARAQLVAWRKSHPEIEEERIDRPLFITGLPRTGTTILHGLLDVDPANRSPMPWEVGSPIPPARAESWENDPRIAEHDQRAGQLQKLCPGLQAVHPMGARMPQECVAMLSSHFQSEQFHTMFDVPSYADWIDSAPCTEAYRWHRQYLQHMQSGGVKAERWLLKSPCHLHMLDHLLAVYPDANIIHTHRHPIDVIVSVASLISMLRSMSSDRIDLHAVGRQQLDWWEKLLGMATEKRRQHADRATQFVDVKMSEIVADPLSVVERVYDHFGFELRGEVKADMERFMRDNPREKHGSHTYTDAEFGIDRDKESHRFNDYCEHFGLS